MISISYVKNGTGTLLASDQFLLLESALEKISSDVDKEIEIYANALDMYTIECDIMGTVDEKAQLYIESEKKNVFEKIGDAVISIAKKVAELINGIIDKIKNIGFKNKTDEEKIKAFMDECKKKDPDKYREMSKEVIAEFKNGELDFNSVKSIKEIRTAYDEFIELAKKKDTTPNDLSVKFEKMKKKAEKSDQSAVVKVAESAAKIIGAVIAIATLKSKLDSAKKSSIDAKEATQRMNDKTIQAIHDMQLSPEPEDRNAVSSNLRKAEIIKNAQIWANNECKNYISVDHSIVTRLDKGLTRFISRYLRERSTDYLQTVNVAHRRLTRKEAERLNTLGQEERVKQLARDAVSRNP